VPIFLVVREPAGRGPLVTRNDVVGSLGQLRVTIRHVREIPWLGRFLLGRFFYSDAVNTLIVVMSVLAVRAMGMTEGQFLILSLVLTVVAILTSFGWGRLADRIGPKRTLLAVLGSWTVGLVLGVLALGSPGTNAGIGTFVVAGTILGSGLGGVQVADRVLMVRLSPPERLGEFFGIYGLAGKASQVIGALAYGLIVFLLLDAMGSAAYQIAVISLLATMLIGLWLVWPVQDGWTGRGESTRIVAPPERLAPSAAPLEPRGDR
jgi:UMF1 family MFS transporter